MTEMGHRCVLELRAVNYSLPASVQLDLSLIGHQQITGEACELFFMGAKQAFDRAVLAVGPSAFKPLDIEKFDRASWFERVLVVGEPNYEPRGERFVNNGSDPMRLASDNGHLKTLRHDE